MCSCGVAACERVGKHPFARLAPNGLDDATTDPKLIREWWKKEPRLNVGIVLGEQAGMFAVDVDPKNGGDATWDQLEREHGPAGETRRSRTGSGGYHIFFLWPGFWVPNSVHKLGLGVDVRGDRGYVVAPPSRHEHGECYEWTCSGPAAPAPAWLLASVVPTARDAPEAPVRRTSSAHVRARASAYLRTKDPAISGRNGHGKLWQATLDVVQGFALDLAVARELLLTEYNPRCQPPWEEGEIDHKITDAAQKTARTPLPCSIRVAPATGGVRAAHGAC
jgi:hypothetical protein